MLRPLFFLAHTCAYIRYFHSLFHAFLVALQESWHFDYLVKLDGDICMRARGVMKKLTERLLNTSKWVWAGQFRAGSARVMDPNSLLYLPEHVWPAHVALPGFMHGGLYVLSRALAEVLARERDDPNVVHIYLEVCVGGTVCISCAVFEHSCCLSKTILIQDVSIAISIARNDTLAKQVQMLSVNNLLTFSNVWYTTHSWFCSDRHVSAHFENRHSVNNYRLCMAGQSRVCGPVRPLHNDARAFL